MRSFAIAALSDVHGPRFLAYVRSSLDIFMKADVVLLAGDIVDRGEVKHARMVVDLIRSMYKGEVVSVFGNEEYDDRKKELIQSCSDVNWLDDEVAYMELKGTTLAIVGTRGILDKPTIWQERHIPNIREVYEKRLQIILKYLREAKRRSDHTVLLTHYTPICQTLEGENVKLWSQMGSLKLTRLIIREHVEIVVHGHAHKSIKTYTNLGATQVYNVALPATKQATLIRVGKRGLENFI
ncbi:MAG: metallophosphoesterase [Thermofilaceae archaeon]|nr:metallophosphoesterase [Thermofilaceae archaeon]MCX8180660.1 metallophosphoesterase [Thermofilaceae archaeon]MDW8003764.1 metallophosphoesterase [Thermofilaceae archaeon]